MMVKCPNCGSEFEVPDYILMVASEVFCPVCGAALDTDFLISQMDKTVVTEPVVGGKAVGVKGSEVQSKLTPIVKDFLERIDALRKEIMVQANMNVAHMKTVMYELVLEAFKMAIHSVIIVENNLQKKAFLKAKQMTGEIDEVAEFTFEDKEEGGGRKYGS